MPFITEILKHKSLSIVGMEKNTGKTECLNYVIKRIQEFDKTIAITSIGVDGENVDQVSNTHKPEIELTEGAIFITSEKHYKQKLIDSEILDISQRSTSLGRLVTARAKSKGKLIFSGPANTLWLKEVISEMDKYGVDTTIVDGALSRKSLGSPSITDAMILTTGAALSANIPTLVAKTKYVYSLINIDTQITKFRDELLSKSQGLWAISSEDSEIFDLEIPSTLLLDKYKDKMFQYGNLIFASGVVGDKVLDFLRVQKNVSDIILVVKDFTKIFASQQTYNSFISKGGTIRVLLKTKLIAVCVNPVSPEGYVLDSEKLRECLSKEMKLPVYDIKSPML